MICYFQHFANYNILLYFIDAVKLVQTEYISQLTRNSHKCNDYYCRVLNFYCEVIEIRTTEAGYYTITSDGTIDIAGYVYENNFTVFDLQINLIKSDYDGQCNGQFKITLYRQMNTSFILVATTTTKKLKQNVFSIFVNGPSNVSMKSKGTYSF